MSPKLHSVILHYQEQGSGGNLPRIN